MPIPFLLAGLGVAAGVLGAGGQRKRTKMHRGFLRRPRTYTIMQRSRLSRHKIKRKKSF